MWAGNLVTENMEKAAKLLLHWFLLAKSALRPLCSASLPEKTAGAQHYLQTEHFSHLHIHNPRDQKIYLQWYWDSWLMLLWDCCYLQKAKSDKGILMTGNRQPPHPSWTRVRKNWEATRCIGIPLSLGGIWSKCSRSLFQAYEGQERDLEQSIQTYQIMADQPVCQTCG